jgi:hypothetical protein
MDIEYSKSTIESLLLNWLELEDVDNLDGPLVVMRCDIEQAIAQSRRINPKTIASIMSMGSWGLEAGAEGFTRGELNAIVAEIFWILNIRGLE